MRDALDRTLRHVVVALLIIALAGVLTSCTDAVAPAGGSETSPDGATAATSVDISAFEFGFTASSETVPAGEITFTLINTGGMDHDLVLEGVDGASTAVVPPAGTGAFTTTLEPGTYLLFCSIGSHRELGMEIEIRVE